MLTQDTTLALFIDILYSVSDARDYRAKLRPDSSKGELVAFTRDTDELLTRMRRFPDNPLAAIFEKVPDRQIVHQWRRIGNEGAHTPLNPLRKYIFLPIRIPDTELKIIINSMKQFNPSILPLSHIDGAWVKLTASS